MKLYLNRFIVLSFMFVIVFRINSQNLVTDTTMIKEVLITGTKIEVAQNLVPFSVTQINHDKIESKGDHNILTTLPIYAPGVFVTERNILGFGVSKGGSGGIKIRGIGGSLNTNVLVLIDGHPQYQGIFGHPLSDAYVASDVEKVEIIRGPSSLLYGSNAMGGVINIITKEQQNEGVNSSLHASYGSYNTQKYAVTIGVKKKKINVFTSFNHDRTDGIRENTDFKITNGYIKAGYQIDENIELTADINLAAYYGNDNGSIYAEVPEPFNIDITRGKAALSFENKFEKLNGGLKIYHNFGKHDLSDGWHSTDRNSGTMFYQTIQPFKGHSATIGIDAKQYGGEGNQGKAGDSLITIHEIAVYTYIRQEFLNKLSLSTGIRAENNSIYGHEFIPMVGINFNPVENSSLKASISKGFRSPTMMELFLYAPNPDLKPEKMTNYELGWTQNFANNNLHTELNVFIAYGNNMIQVTGEGPNAIRENIGSFSNRGVELATKYLLGKQMTIHANYSFLYMEKKVLAAPKEQYNFIFNYKIKKFNFNLAMQQISKIYTKLNHDVSENYTILNANIGMEISKNVMAFVKGNNLLDKEYQINYGYPMPKINFSTGIKLNF